MIYELRIYTCLSGRMPALQKRFEEHTLTIWKRFGIRQVGFWTTVLGPDNNDLTYLLAWDSLAERERIWDAFMVDPEWVKARTESERDGPIVATIASSILKPTKFSELK